MEDELMDIGVVIYWLLFVVLAQKPAIHRSSLPEIIGRGIVGGIFGLIIVYFVMPTFIARTLVFWVGAILAVNGIITVLLSAEKQEKSDSTAAAGAFVLGAILVVGLIFAAIASGIAYAENLHDLPGIVPATANVSAEVSPDHIRVVPQATAVWKASKTVGELGFKFDALDPHIQSVNGSLSWITPYEFKDDFAALWYGGEGSTGYVITSAEEAYAESRTVMGLNMVYIPTAIFNSNLYRNIYFNYPSYYRGESVFQLDDKGEPIYVTAMERPAFAGLIGMVAKGVVITYPETGEMQFYAMDKVPDYIVRTIDEGMVEQYLVWWGEYIHGFWNSLGILGQRDLKKPTGGIALYIKEGSGEIYVDEDSIPDVYLVYGTDGRLYWFSAISSQTSTTKSMVEYVLIDVRAWPLKATSYAANGYYNDIGAAGNIQQDGTVSNTMGYKTTQPIMYHIGGKPVWIAAVLSSQNEIKRVGIVEAVNGNTFVGATKEEAIAKFLAAEGGLAEPTAKIMVQAREIAAQIDFANMTNGQLLTVAQGALKELGTRGIQ